MEKTPAPDRRSRTTSFLRVGCFGDFRSADRICRHHCAIRIRCAIERDQKIYLEVFTEMADSDDQLMNFQ